LVLLLALIFLSFFGTLSLSAWMFPGNYDWRYRVISSLLSPRDNPRHYWLAASGVALTAVLMLPFAEHLRRHLQSIAPRMAKMSAAAFTVGIAALISACFVVPQHVQETFGIRRLHELLGRTAAGCFAVAMLCGCWCAWNGRAQNSTATTVFWIWSLVTLMPLIGLFGSEALLLLTPAGTVVGRSDSERSTAFCFLASRLLGMDRRGRDLRLSLRGGFTEPSASKR
jgi:hypothetical protein